MGRQQDHYQVIFYRSTMFGRVSVNYGSIKKPSNTTTTTRGICKVQIVEVTEQGDSIVEGKRQTEVNGEVHEMSIAGTVRVNDTDGRNQVLSYRIANAAISYQKMGGIKDKKGSRGILKKVVFMALAQDGSSSSNPRTNSKTNDEQYRHAILSFLPPFYAHV